MVTVCRISVEFGQRQRGKQMEILVYREGAEKVESGHTAEQLPELLKEEKAVIWVDMEAPTEADDRVLLDVFRFHPLTVEDCRENRHCG